MRQADLFSMFVQDGTAIYFRDGKPEQGDVSGAVGNGAVVCPMHRDNGNITRFHPGGVLEGTTNVECPPRLN